MPRGAIHTQRLPILNARVQPSIFSCVVKCVLRSTNKIIGLIQQMRGSRLNSIKFHIFGGFVQLKSCRTDSTFFQP